MSIDQVIESLLKQIPEMVALIVVVRLFIIAQKDRDKANAELLKDIGAACHKFQSEIVRDTTVALEHNSKALEKNTEALGRAADYLRVIRANGQ